MPFPGIGEQLLGAPAEFAKAFARQGLVDPVSGAVIHGVYTGLRAAGVEMDPFAETAVGKGLASASGVTWLPVTEPISQFTGGCGWTWTSLLVPGEAVMAKGRGTSRNPWRYGYRTGRRRGQRPS
jgi:hypothetical protein